MKRFFLFIICVIVSGCSSQSAMKMEIPSHSYVYGSYEEGQYSLHVVNDQTFNVEKKISVGSGWADYIAADNFGRVWVPLQRKADTTALMDEVRIWNPKDGSIKMVKVGMQPTKVFFKGDDAYVFCVGDGRNPSVYKVDVDLRVQKVTNLKSGGNLIGKDGKAVSIVETENNFYFTSLQDDGHPTLVRMSLDGEIMMKEVSDNPVTTSDVIATNNFVYVGISDRGYNDLLLTYDRRGMNKVKDIGIKQLIGKWTGMGNGNVAILNNDGNSFYRFNVEGHEKERVVKSKTKIDKLFNVEGVLMALSGKKLTIYDKDGGIKRTLEASPHMSNIVRVGE